MNYITLAICSLFLFCAQIKAPKIETKGIPITRQEALEFKTDFKNNVKGYNSIINGKISIKELVQYYNDNNTTGTYNGIRIYNIIDSDSIVKHIIAIGDSTPNSYDTYTGPVLLLDDSGICTKLTDPIMIKKYVNDFKSKIKVNVPNVKSTSSSWYDWDEFKNFISLNNYEETDTDIYFKIEFGLNKKKLDVRFHGICSIIYFVDKKNNRLDTAIGAQYTNGRFDVGDPCPNNCGSYDPPQ